MNKATARANAVKSKIRARVEYVFAEQKDGPLQQPRDLSVFDV